MRGRGWRVRLKESPISKQEQESAGGQSSQSEPRESSGERPVVPKPSAPAKGSASKGKGGSAEAWADRGWWLAVQYGTLPGKQRFLDRLDEYRGLGSFKELVERGGQITYRNLFRSHELRAAWKLLSSLNRWKSKVQIFLNGEAQPWKVVSDVVWCGGYLADSRPCRGDPEKRRFDLGCERKISFAPFRFEHREDSLRHVMTFANIDESGVYHWDIEAVVAWLGGGPKARSCPLSPLRWPDRLAEALAPISARELEWPVVLRVSEALKKSLGASSFTRDQAFVLAKGATSLVGPVDLELSWQKGEVWVSLGGEDEGRRLDRETTLSKRVLNVLESGHRLRAVRSGERYQTGAGRRDQIEQVFRLVHWFVLDQRRDPRLFPGFDREPLPHSTPGYIEWARAALGSLETRIEDVQHD